MYGVITTAHLVDPVNISICSATHSFARTCINIAAAPHISHQCAADNADTAQRDKIDAFINRMAVSSSQDKAREREIRVDDQS